MFQLFGAILPVLGWGVIETNRNEQTHLQLTFIPTAVVLHLITRSNVVSALYDMYCDGIKPAETNTLKDRQRDRQTDRNLKKQLHFPVSVLIRANESQKFVNENNFNASGCKRLCLCSISQY